MDIDVISLRVKTRLSDPQLDCAILEEMITTVGDRINLRVGTDDVPTALESIVVEAAVKMYRRINFEGISSESADTISTSFVDDVLSEYQEELSAYKKRENRATLRFI